MDIPSTSPTDRLKIFPFSLHSGSDVEPMMLKPEPTLDSPETISALSFDEEIRSKQFGAILIICLAGAAIFMVNAWLNIRIVEIETTYGNGISIGWFLVITMLLAILTAHMVYKPYIIDRANGRSVVIQALIWYVFSQMFWSAVLFHSRSNRTTGGIAGFTLLATTIWLGWTCYNLNKESIYIFLLLLLWALYLQIYTYDVNSHPWVPISQQL